MAFKMRGMNFGQGTGSAFKKEDDPYARALKNDPNLPDYIRKRENLEKGSAEWDANQNRINKAYGQGPMRGETTETKREGGRKNVVVEDTPGVSTTTTKTTPSKTKKTVVDHIEGTVTTTKKKGDKKPKIRKRKKYAETKLGQSKLGQVFVSKKNKKGGINASK